MKKTSRGTFRVKSKDKLSSNLLRKSVPKPLDICKYINYGIVKEAFDKKLITDVNNQTFFQTNYGLDLNTIDPDGGTFFAKFMSLIPDFYDFDFLQKLIITGLDIDKCGIGKYSPQNSAPLAVALYLGKADVAEFLIKNGATLEPACVDPEKCRGCNPLQSAISGSLYHIVELLLTKGVDINRQCKYGYSPLHEAVLQNNIELMKRFIKRGADVNAILQSFWGGTALHLAMGSDYSKATKFLLNHELIDVNLLYKGFSVLHYAVEEDAVKCIDELLNANPDINIVNEHNQIAVEMKYDGKKNSEVAKTLKKHIIKLHAAGFHLCDRNLSAIAKIKYKNFYIQCCKEIDLMKSISISSASHLNFYNLLSIDHRKLALCLESLDDQENLRLKIQEKFPTYAGMIEFKVNKAYEWIKLREVLYIAVYNLFNNHLPSTIMEILFSFFNATDLIHLRWLRKVDAINTAVHSLFNNNLSHSIVEKIFDYLTFYEIVEFQNYWKKENLQRSEGNVQKLNTNND